MTPDSLDLQLERSAQAMRLEGMTDAAFGRLPRFAHDAYLEGYCQKLKQLPQNIDGEIQHPSPHKRFAHGWVDGAQ
jgi:hypothetical protein